MLSSLRAALVALVASAVAANAAPRLSIMTSVPNVEVNGLRNLKVVVTVFNTGDEPLKLLKDPHGVLDSFPADSFTITSATGVRPLFSGAAVSFDPEYAAGRGDPGVFTVLAPGASTNVTHDLSAAYNFTRSGGGGYSIKPSNRFTHVDGDGTLKALYATVGDVARVELSGDLAVSPPVFYKRDQYPGCSPERVQKLIAIATIADALVREAIFYIEDLESPTPRYIIWFGIYDYENKEFVKGILLSVERSSFSTFIYVCVCEDMHYYAFVMINDFGKIYLCGAFWVANDRGIRSKPGVLIHQSSTFTFNGGVIEHRDGVGEALQLALDHPELAIENADNIQYFAENFPHSD